MSYLVNAINQVAGWVSNMKSKASEAARGFVNNVKSGLSSIGSAVSNVGHNLVQGIWSGMSSSMNWIKTKIRGWVGDVTKFIKNLFGIKSPSTVMRDQVGKYLAEGIGVGFEDEMKNVERDMADAIPTSFDVSASVTGSGRASGEAAMVAAFKKALSDMKIELDSEVAGAFVDKTVTKLIYA
jgi:phage-related protein